MTSAPAGQNKAAEENPFQETAQKQAEKTPAQKRAETIAAKKAEEAEAEAPVKDEATDPVKDEADKGTPEKDAPKKEKKEKVGEDEVLHTADFDQYPLSATHGDVVGTVALNGAVPVLKLALVGWIGEEPMVIRAEDARDLEKVLKDLRKQVKK